jgi:UDP-N-acetylmuramoylalanine--D-glutamate ligase
MFKNKKITVMGIGLNGGGVGIVSFLVAQGARVIATDLKTRDQLSGSLEKLKGLKNVTYVLGQHRREDFINVDMVIKNPLVPWDDKNIKLALEKGIPVEMDSSLFFKLCKNPIIGVTGTKGKTTTATIIYEILKSAGKNVIKVGIGQTSVLDKLSLLKKDSVVVFELSSWRLSALGKFKLSPNIAVFKNIMPDHLNYYKTMEKYLADKKYIFSSQKPKDWLVINNDDEVLKEVSKEAKSQVIKFSFSEIKNEKSVFIEDEILYLNNGIDIKKLIEVRDIPIPGRHNLTNVMAAVGAVFAFGLTALEIKKALPILRGVPHRLEFVREIAGVKFYNDTAATIPDAAISALESFDKPIILIAGGADKNLEFENFAKKINQKTKGVVLFKGLATDKILKELEKNQKDEIAKVVAVVDSMEKAITEARIIAQKGDIVLLSPGAASFGIFNNEFDRGDQFKDIVKKLK